MHVYKYRYIHIRICVEIHRVGIFIPYTYRVGFRYIINRFLYYTLKHGWENGIKREVANIYTICKKS